MARQSAGIPGSRLRQHVPVGLGAGYPEHDAGEVQRFLDGPDLLVAVRWEQLRRSPTAIQPIGTSAATAIGGEERLVVDHAAGQVAVRSDEHPVRHAQRMMPGAACPIGGAVRT